MKIRAASIVAALCCSASIALASPAAGGALRGGEPDPETDPEPTYSFDGIASLSGCSGAVFRYQGQSMDSKALILTNGHCLGNMAPYEVLVDVPSNREITLFDADDAKAATLETTRIVYATMHQTDMAILELDVTYQALADDSNVHALVLAQTRGEVGEDLVIVSGLWEYVTACPLDGFVYAMQESLWSWSDSLRFGQECVTFGGTSGSPVISVSSGLIVGVNNTGYEGGMPCSRNNPCEIDEDGEITTVPDGSYGQQTYQLYGCLDADFALDLGRDGCDLPRPSGVLSLGAIDVLAGDECDSDGTLDAGETATLSVTVANDGPVALESTTLEVSAMSSAVSFPDGTSLSVPLIAPESATTVEIAVALADDVSGIETVHFEVRATDPGSAADDVVAVHVARVNYDTEPNSSPRDDVEGGAGDWSSATIDGPDDAGWSRQLDDDGNTAWHGVDIATHGDQRLVTPAFEVGDDAFVVRFSHRFKFETSRGTFWDGGVIELSTDGGSTWSDVGERTGDVGYGGVLTNESGNPLGDRSAFVGESPGWPDTSTVELDFGTELAGETVHLRFRLGTDAGAGDYGWDIDDISVEGTTNLPFGSVADDPAGCRVGPDDDDDNGDGDGHGHDHGDEHGGCSSSSTPAPWFLALPLLFAIVRRRRQASI